MSLPPAVHFGCAGGAVRYVAPSPPLRGPILFWQDRKEWAAGGIPHRLVQKNEPPEASHAIPAQKRYGPQSGGDGAANLSAPSAHPK